MKKKVFIVFIVLTLLLCNTEAQNVPSFYPFKGFHVGITGQTEFIQKSSFVALTGTTPTPNPRWTYGWEVGIEFSYHFAKYIGLLLGVNYGTTVSYNSDIYNSELPEGMGEWIVNGYDRNFMNPNFKEIIFPVKLEFHYPLRKDFFFIAEVGIKIKGVEGRLAYNKYGIGLGTYSKGSHLPATPDDYNSELNVYETKPYYEEVGIRDESKISCNLLFGLGLYYKLPYGDLLRLTAGVNISFSYIVTGYYQYFLTESYGTFAVKNDFIYTQLSYIHTFNFQKAKRYVKRQEFSFSKKERRSKILDLLNIW